MKQEFGYFLKNAKFRAALGLTLLLSYGYAIATTRVSIDSLEGDRYIGTGGVMLSTGRFGMNLWAAVLGYGRAEPSYAFGIDLLAALLLALAAVSFCALLRKAAQDRISMFGYGLFACLFVSYPLMNEIWEYSGANVCVCGGYLLDAAALNLLWDARQPGVLWRGRALRMGAAALCLMVVCSSYESLAAVFVLAVFALLTLEQLLAAERPRLAAVLTEGLWYAAALVGGLCLRMLVTTGIHLVLPQAAANGATEILWAFYPFVYLAKLLVKGILINYALRGCFYLPIAELAVAALVFIVLVIALAVRKKRPLLLLTGAGTLFSLVLLSFVQGRYSPYRTCQVFALFVAPAAAGLSDLCGAVGGASGGAGGGAFRGAAAVRSCRRRHSARGGHAAYRDGADRGGGDRDAGHADAGALGLVSVRSACRPSDRNAGRRAAHRRRTRAERGALSGRSGPGRARLGRVRRLRLRPASGQAQKKCDRHRLYAAGVACGARGCLRYARHGVQAVSDRGGRRRAR